MSHESSRYRGENNQDNLTISAVLLLLLSYTECTSISWILIVNIYFRL